MSIATTTARLKSDVKTDTIIWTPSEELASKSASVPNTARRLSCRLSVLCLHKGKQSSQMKKSSRSAAMSVSARSASHFPRMQVICRPAGNWLRFTSKNGIPAIFLDRSSENPGCLESFRKDRLQNAGFFLSFMAKTGVRSETSRNTVRFPLRFSTE